MIDLDYLGWLFAGFIGALKGFEYLKQFIKKRDDKMIAKSKKDEEDDKSLNGVWDLNRKMKKQLDITSELASETNVLLFKFLSHRDAQVPKELLKYESLKSLLEHHVAEEPQFQTYLDGLEDIERQEVERAAKMSLETGDTNQQH